MKPWEMPRRAVPTEPRPRTCWSCGREARDFLSVHEVRHRRTHERRRVALCGRCIDEQSDATWRLAWALTDEGPTDPYST